ncbi:MAG: SAM-dependent methyltransferase [Salinivirgaceae bacterium]|nr:SAM-dependent methyltransferase [Salinivirgaceae bacterium]MDY0280129.1 SAM-dependent methyltransferase [Salinivirgaceae bacterium]
MNGILYLIPTPISDEETIETITADTKQLLPQLKYYVVENIRTARRFLKSVDKSIDINRITFFEIGKNVNAIEEERIVKLLKDGNNIGLMSEAGVPGVADPGSVIVMAAHNADVKVMPLVGASSILLLLMASGLNGQRFAFHGYLPVKPMDRQRTLKEIERESSLYNQTQIFIETPYRNQHMFNDIVKTCSNGTLLTLGYDITGKEQILKTKTVESWKKEKIEFQKKPAIFALLAHKN